jgi:hypothetical protein
LPLSAILPRPGDEIDIVREAGLKIRPRRLAGLDPKTLRWDEDKAIYAVASTPVKTGLAPTNR